MVLMLLYFSILIRQEDEDMSHDGAQGTSGCLGNLRITSGELVELQGARRTSAEPGELLGNFWGARGTSGDLGELRGSSVQPRWSSGIFEGNLGGV